MDGRRSKHVGRYASVSASCTMKVASMSASPRKRKQSAAGRSGRTGWCRRLLLLLLLVLMLILAPLESLVPAGPEQPEIIPSPSVCSRVSCGFDPPSPRSARSIPPLPRAPSPPGCPTTGTARKQPSRWHSSFVAASPAPPCACPCRTCIGFGSVLCEGRLRDARDGEGEKGEGEGKGRCACCAQCVLCAAAQWWTRKVRADTRANVDMADIAIWSANDSNALSRHDSFARTLVAFKRATKYLANREPPHSFTCISICRFICISNTEEASWLVMKMKTGNMKSKGMRKSSSSVNRFVRKSVPIGQSANWYRIDDSSVNV